MPHFEEEPRPAKTFRISDATPLHTEIDVFQSNSPAHDVFIEQPSTLKLKRVAKTKFVKKAASGKIENLENLASAPEDEFNYDGNETETEIDVATSDSDEGYGSEATELNPKLVLPIVTLVATVRTAPNFDLRHTLNACPKSQHFAKTLTVHALHPSTLSEAGQIIARYINLPLLKASLSVPKNKGSAKGKKVNSNSKANFYTSIEELNSCNSDGLAFAKALFCAKGQLLGKHRSSATQYLGPWGAELEGSPVLVVKYLFVSRSFRRQGIARLLLESLIVEMEVRMARNGGKGRVQHVVVFPAVIKEDFAHELEGKSEEEKRVVEEREYRNAVGAYRALGFRRIGLSKWFALAVDESHVSRGLAVEDDLDCEEDEN